MFKSIVVVCSAGLLLTASGCSMAVKQAYHGVVGASGKFYEIKVVDEEVLKTYTAVRVEPFTNDLGERVPQKVIDRVNEMVPKEVEDSGFFDGDGDRVLSIKGRIIHYNGKSGLEGAVGSVLSGGEECVCRVELLDARSGSLVGEAVCWGTVKSAVRRGSTELGIGVGKGVTKWLEERLPDEEETQQEE